MDDPQSLARWFLWIGGALFLVAFALPLLIAPLRWARLFQWKLGAKGKDQNLTVYLGRCLGAVSVATVYFFFRVTTDPALYPLVFELIIATGVLMTVVHVWGAIERTQPWTETAEIALYAGLTGAAAWIYSGL